MIITLQDLFQHTATRRWLPVPHPIFCYWSLVSTHSHPKVAAHAVELQLLDENGFNTQPPEGGCGDHEIKNKLKKLFQHTATRRWLLNFINPKTNPRRVSTHSHPKVAASASMSTFRLKKFQHTATRRWLRENELMPSSFR